MASQGKCILVMGIPTDATVRLSALEGMLTDACEDLPDIDVVDMHEGYVVVVLKSAPAPGLTGEHDLRVRLKDGGANKARVSVRIVHATEEAHAIAAAHLCGTVTPRETIPEEVPPQDLNSTREPSPASKEAPPASLCRAPARSPARSPASKRQPGAGPSTALSEAPLSFPPAQGCGAASPTSAPRPVGVVRQHSTLPPTEPASESADGDGSGGGGGGGGGTKDMRLNRRGLNYKCSRCGLPKKGHVCRGGAIIQMMGQILPLQPNYDVHGRPFACMPPAAPAVALPTARATGVVVASGAPSHAQVHQTPLPPRPASTAAPLARAQAQAASMTRVASVPYPPAASAHMLGSPRDAITVDPPGRKAPVTKTVVVAAAAPRTAGSRKEARVAASARAPVAGKRSSGRQAAGGTSATAAGGANGQGGMMATVSAGGGAAPQGGAPALSTELSEMDVMMSDLAWQAVTGAMAAASEAAAKGAVEGAGPSQRPPPVATPEEHEAAGVLGGGGGHRPLTGRGMPSALASLSRGLASGGMSPSVFSPTQLLHFLQQVSPAGLTPSNFGLGPSAAATPHPGAEPSRPSSLRRGGGSSSVDPPAVPAGPESQSPTSRRVTASKSKGKSPLSPASGKAGANAAGVAAKKARHR